MIVIVDNKRLNMTKEENALYLKIVKSYTTNTNKGEDLFIDLFESDQDGIITILKPPSRRHTSFEVFLFLMSLMQNQHLRKMYSLIDDCANQIKTKLSEIN